mmetsp:Transcript_30969/g.72238  ORF Transcript_30969/g.72238 Transcript_30969/m.72238 type:complete len:91 (-) Transcript_30969:1262-1534(-)
MLLMLVVLELPVVRELRLVLLELRVVTVLADDIDVLVVFDVKLLKLLAVVGDVLLLLTEDDDVERLDTLEGELVDVTDVVGGTSTRPTKP